jgi:lysophospholipid acyltransferase (LPLAT)-like uncharacterized protein
VKLCHPLLLRIVGFFAALFVRLWLGTIRFHAVALGKPMLPTPRDPRGRSLFAFWHEVLLLPALQYGRPDVSLLISHHADGELIATICRHLGFRVVRGSTTRHGVAALRDALRASERGHMVLTPDGPKGPRRRLQAGLIFLAAKSGRPLVPVGVAARGGWRLRSWDRFVLPYPFTDIWCLTGEPMFVPADANREQLEAYRQRFEKVLEEVTAEAERRAGVGVSDEERSAERVAAA